MNTPGERARDIEALTFIFVPSPPPAASAPARAVRRLAQVASPPVAAGVTLGIVLLASLVLFLLRS